MGKKRIYIKPEINKIVLDYTISLQMQSQPHDPPPRPRGGGGNQNDPFSSPFDNNKPFS